jgi:hypothetical protein
MTLKNIRFARAENLSKALREKHNLPEKGLVIIESLNPNLRENIIAIKEGGIREYLLSKGKFIEESPTQQ